MKLRNIKYFKRSLNKMSACLEPVEWVGKRDLQTAYKDCEHAGWMLWFLGEMKDKKGFLTHKQVVWLACKCARTSLKYVVKGDKRPLEAIKTAERWVKGKATIDEVCAAAYAAYAAAYAADAAHVAAYATYATYAAYAADAAHVAAYAAYAAAYAADAAHVAAYAAYAASAAAYAARAASAAADAARKKAYIKMCGIIRCEIAKMRGNDDLYICCS